MAYSIVVVLYTLGAVLMYEFVQEKLLGDMVLYPKTVWASILLWPLLTLLVVLLDLVMWWDSRKHLK